MEMIVIWNLRLPVLKWEINFVVIDDDLEMVIHSILLFTTSPCIGVNEHLMMIGAIFGTRVI
jgi:hypothetical protein